MNSDIAVSIICLILIGAPLIIAFCVFRFIENDAFMGPIKTLQSDNDSISSKDYQ